MLQLHCVVTDGYRIDTCTRVWQEKEERYLASVQSVAAAAAAVFAGCHQHTPIQVGLSVANVAENVS